MLRTAALTVLALLVAVAPARAVLNPVVEAAVDPDHDGNWFSFCYGSRLAITLPGTARRSAPAARSSATGTATVASTPTTRLRPHLITHVIEGRLAETPTPDATGMDRRAFGEFEGPRGELASYAIGWTTGADPRVGRLTVGIGAGNPGGASFHAVIFAGEDGHAFSLVDEPFEEVPQGGPDITAAEARAHEDLPFVWFVADQVMARDRRAGWLLHRLRGTRCIQTPEVFALSEPILLVCHDSDDDLWQLIGPADAEPGEEAVRERPGGAWTRRPETDA